MSERKPGVGFTRFRDLAAVAVVGALVGFAIVRFSYSQLPAFPRLAAALPAIAGLVEAGAGWVLRTRIREGGSGGRRPVAPLTAARTLMIAKASSLTGAALIGLWIGMLAYLLPDATVVSAAQGDAVTGVVGLVASVILVGGALFLEYCCRAPDWPPRP